MEYIKLKDLCEKEERFVAPNDDAHIDYVDISSVDNKSKSLTKYDTYIFAKAPSRARKRVKHGDVIVSTVRPNLNAVARFNIQTPHTPLVSTGFCVLRSKSDVEPSYIYFFCTSPNFVRQMVSKATGASYPAVSDTIVRDAKLPKHTAEQRARIVTSLSKTKKIIECRRAQLAKLDELVKCRFVEMFGDPVTNPKKWNVCKLINACTKLTDGTHSSPENLPEGDFKYVTAKNIKRHGFDFSEITYINEKVHQGIYSRCNPEYGDVLYIKDGVTTGIAMVNTLHEEFSLLSSVALLKPCKQKLDSHFLSELLNNDEMYTYMRKGMGGAAITRLTLKKIGDIQIPLPDLTLQNSFSSFVHRIDKLRFVIYKIMGLGGRELFLSTGLVRKW